MSGKYSVQELYNNFALLDRDKLSIISLIYSAHFFSHYFGLILPALFPLFYSELNLKLIDIGTLAGLMALGSALCSIHCGALVDRYGPVIILIGGASIRAGTVILMAVADTFYQLAFLAFLSGIGNSVYHPVANVLISKTVKEKSIATTLSVHTFFGYAGWVMAPITCGLLSSIMDWRSILILSGAIGMLIPVYALINFSHINKTDSNGLSSTHTFNTVLSDLLPIFKSPTLLSYFLYSIIISAGLKSFQVYLVTVVVTLGSFTINQADFFLSCFIGVNCISILFGGAILNRSKNPHITMMLLLQFAAISIFLLNTSVNTTSLIMLLITSSGILIGLTIPMRDRFIIKHSPEFRLGTATGYVSLGQDIGSIIGPIVIGYLLTYGHASLFFPTISFILFLASILFFSTSKYKTI